MTNSDSPLNRSIGLTGAIRWLLAVAAVIAIGAAFAEGRYGLALAGVVILVVVLGTAYWLWRSQQEP